MCARLALCDVFSARFALIRLGWDLEQNKIIRNYHGHLSGVYSIALHPTLDLLMTGGRDSTCRVWDIRTKRQSRTSCA